jgi:hypothetical protein
MYERPLGAIRPDEAFFSPGRAQWALVQAIPLIYSSNTTIAYPSTFGTVT